MLIDSKIVKQNHSVDETFMICSGLPYIRSIGIDMIYIKRIRVSTLSLRDYSSVNSLQNPCIYMPYIPQYIAKYFPLDIILTANTDIEA